MDCSDVVLSLMFTAHGNSIGILLLNFSLYLLNFYLVLLIGVVTVVPGSQIQFGLIEAISVLLVYWIYQYVPCNLFCLCVAASCILHIWNRSFSFESTLDLLRCVLFDLDVGRGRYSSWREVVPLLSYSSR